MYNTYLNVENASELFAIVAQDSLKTAVGYVVCDPWISLEDLVFKRIKRGGNSLVNW
jgi:hypothetical protein